MANASQAVSNLIYKISIRSTILDYIILLQSCFFVSGAIVLVSVMTSEVAVGDVALVSGTFQIVKNRKILRMLTCLTVDDLFGSEFESELPTNDVGLVEAESVVANAAPLSVDLDFD